MRRLFVEEPLPLAEAAAWATPEELTAAAGFAPARAREYLAWRAIVRREVGRDARIGYDAVGAPVLENYPYRLAVSHGAGRVAVGISDARCAVDIERTDRNFSRILSRYLTPEEQQLSTHPHFPAVAWSAKETLYKYAGRREVDLLRDLHIEGIAFPASEAGGPATGEGEATAGGSSTVNGLSTSGRLSEAGCGRLFVRCTDAAGGERALCLRFYHEPSRVIVFRFDGTDADEPFGVLPE